MTAKTVWAIVIIQNLNTQYFLLIFKTKSSNTLLTGRFRKLLISVQTHETIYPEFHTKQAHTKDNVCQGSAVWYMQRTCNRIMTTITNVLNTHTSYSYPKRRRRQLHSNYFQPISATALLIHPYLLYQDS
jgi:hypothetical protein